MFFLYICCGKQLWLFEENISDQFLWKKLPLQIVGMPVFNYLRFLL